MLKKIFGITEQLSIQLQAKKIDFVAAMEEVQHVTDIFRSWRSESIVFINGYAEAVKLFQCITDDPSAELETPRLTSKQKYRSNVPS